MKHYTTFGNMRYLLRCTKEYLPVLLVWTALSVAVKVALPVLEMYIPKIVIGEITNGSLRSIIVTVLSVTIALAVLSACSKFCEGYIFHNKNLMGTYYIQKVSMKGLVTDYANQETEEFRTLQAESYRLCGSINSTLRDIYSVWITFLSGIIGFIFYSAILTRLNIIVLLFLIASTVVRYFIGFALTKWTAENNAERTKYHHRLGYIDRVAEDIQSAKDIRLYDMESWFHRVYISNIKGIAKWYKRYNKVVLKTSFAGASISLLREGIAYGYLIYLAFAGQIAAGDFVLYFAAITGFSGWLGNIFNQLTEMKQVSVYVTKFRSYLDFPDKFTREGGIKTTDKSAFPCKIELKNVSYRYLGAETDTLHNITLTINPAEHLGIVGLNGAGKTTLVKLICGLIDPTDGTVFYDGVDIREYNRTEFYRLFAAVFQNYSLLPLSIAEVVAENFAESGDHDKVRACLTTAGLWDKIASLPDGLQTPIDKSVNDDATAFSGGEIQKLLLARAIYKDSPVLLLDEPTAALDPIAENNLYENYHEITAEKTTVFISHRLASTRFCDRILLIDGGAIAESGTHDELLNQRGIYHTLFETQAKYYREVKSDEE